jgi:hypothetical protein
MSLVMIRVHVEIMYILWFRLCGVSSKFFLFIGRLIYLGLIVSVGVGCAIVLNFDGYFYSFNNVFGLF